MANYSVTTTTAEDYSYAAVASSLETAIEAADTAKTIRHYSILKHADQKFYGVVVIDT